MAFGHELAEGLAENVGGVLPIHAAGHAVSTFARNFDAARRVGNILHWGNIPHSRGKAHVEDRRGDERGTHSRGGRRGVRREPAAAWVIRARGQRQPLPDTKGRWSSNHD
jgi:hypothetical protein